MSPRDGYKYLYFEMTIPEYRAMTLRVEEGSKHSWQQ